MGMVTFVGAGPYDDQLLTLAGKQALAKADCVLYDQLIDASLLSHTKGICLFVGKKGHHPSVSQDEINALLIEKAKQYEHVVRLKGGDSFVFGRGGEEAIALQNANIAYTFVPGVTSAIAVCEMAGIPVTHRGVANGFLVLSAHLKDHSLNIPLEQVKNENITLIFLMGNSRLSQIVDYLRMARRREDTPMAVISQGCSPYQDVVTGTLTTIVSKFNQHPIPAPSILVVGNVVALRNQIYPYHTLPLYQKRGLVFTLDQIESPLTILLKNQGATMDECQCGEILHKPIEKIETLLSHYQLFIFTSKHAIHAFFASLYLHHKDARNLYGKQFACIGEKSAMVLQSYGICADIIGDGSHQSLEAKLEESEILISSMLYLQGAMSSRIIVNDTKCPSYILYENQEVKTKPLSSSYDFLCFTCASSVERCPLDIKNITCVAIGETTSDALKKRGCKHIIMAKTPSFEAMVEAIIKENTNVSR